MVELVTGADLVPFIRGALGPALVNGGVEVLRLPRWTQTQYSEGSSTKAAARQGSGVRIEFVSAATWVELDATFESGELASFRHRVVAQTRDVLVEVEPIVAGANARPQEVLSKRPKSLRFNLGGSGRTARNVAIWLPQGAASTVHAVRSDRPLERSSSALPKWIHYGSSISDSIGVDSPLAVWPVAVAHSLELDLLNLGLSGNAQLDSFVARSIRDADADLISLKLGINVVNDASMNARAFTSAFHGFLDLIRDGHPHTPILVVSPIVCPPHETSPGPTQYDGLGHALSGSASDPPGRGLTISRVRQILLGCVSIRSEADKDLYYLDGRRLLGESDGSYLPDNLHPNAEGYRMIGERFAKELQLRCLSVGATRE